MKSTNQNEASMIKAIMLLIQKWVALVNQHCSSSCYIWFFQITFKKKKKLFLQDTLWLCFWLYYITKILHRKID